VSEGNNQHSLSTISTTTEHVLDLPASPRRRQSHFLVIFAQPI
jgi:hypothetical protein